MISFISVASLVVGAVCSCVAHRFPQRSVGLETYGGVLLIGGLVLLGAFLPRF
jgi:hypothetical protein